MVGLIDIAPSVETVDMQGTPVTVHGVSAKAWPISSVGFPSCVC